MPGQDMPGHPLPAHQVRLQTVTIGGQDYIIRSLLDRQQYADPLGEAEAIGMSPSGWPLFGQIWPSARVLALLMDTAELAGKRVLEVGAGLALASLVIHRRNGDVTVSDWHPESEAFLKENLSLNGMRPLKYVTGNWETGNPALGRFDLIIGSDVLYERQQPAQLAAFIHAHATPQVEVIIVDADRGNRPAFCREMNGLGYRADTERAAGMLENGDTFKGCVVRLKRW